MDKWMELQRFYEEWKQLKQHCKNPEDFGFTSADGKHHIYICTKQMSILMMKVLSGA